MQTELIRSILQSMNWHSFSDYVFELLSLRDLDDNSPLNVKSSIKLHEWRSTKDLSNTIAEGTLEQHYQRGFDVGGYSVFFIQPLPIDLFDFPLKGTLSDPLFRKKLKKYKTYSDRRLAGWQFWTDGDHMMEQVAVVSNTSGLSEQYYQDVILPELEHVLKEMQFEALPLIGTIDSFLELSPHDTAEALQRFFAKRHGFLTITFEEEKFRVQEAIAGNYISAGVLKKNLVPCEPVVVRSLHDHLALISEFQSLLNGNPSEKKLERFLVQHFQEIFGYKYDRIEAQVWLRFPELDIANKPRRIDMFLRNSVEGDWDLFELKKCTKLTHTYRDVPVLTAEIHSAIQQLKGYGTLLSQDRVRRFFASQGIEYYHPSLHLVVGRSPEIPVAQWRWLKATHSRDIKLITYDELIKEMLARVEILKHEEPFDVC
jgi:hypothetical protein